MYIPAYDEVHVAGLRALVRAGAEDRPGVYRMIGADGSVIYVGKSASLRDRVGSYFQPSTKLEHKKAGLLDQVVDFEVIQTDNGAEFQSAFHWHALDKGIAHTHIKPRTPRLNGKVERSHRIDAESSTECSTASSSPG